MIGIEWVVEAFECDPAALAAPQRVAELITELNAALDLHPVGEPLLHQFPHPGGLTALQLLSESHIACHTYPEFASLTLNVFCCRPRPDFDFAPCLARLLGAAQVRVRKLDRPYALNPARAEVRA